MSGYFRGQGLVALSNCLMFTLGFWIVGFPLPVLMGVFIGLVSFVPYLQLIGYVPAVALALIKSADTGQSFWVLIGLVTLVYIVIQVIQDTFVTPRIMGHIMGLPSAIVLLAHCLGLRSRHHRPHHRPACHNAIHQLLPALCSRQCGLPSEQ